MGVLAQKIHNLPPLPGVYLLKGAAGELLYVGKAKSLAQRVRSYLASDLPDSRLRELMSRATDVDSVVTATEVEALLLEATLIRQHRPHFNILLKDDKSFPYVRISVQEEVPRLSVTRQVRNDGARYLGPYTDVKRLRRTLREIRRAFPVRTCRNFEEHRRADRPCLYFHIRRCVGPCCSRARVGPEEYRTLVDRLVLFLTGRDDLAGGLEADMAQAAERREFEHAARLRDQIALLKKARVPQSVVAPGARDTDVLGIARHAARAVVATLVLRDGRVVGKESRQIERADGLDDGALVQLVVSQRYLPSGDVPRRLVVSKPLSDGPLVEEALARRAGRAVEIVVPQRGRERRLLDLAERNAAVALEDVESRGAGRRARYSADVLDLQRALSLPRPPYRVVCFDISNLGPTHAVAAVVAGENGAPRRAGYRRMRIRRPGPDDFAMIAEAVERYWARVESDELPRPDLVVVDGGLGQVRAAEATLERSSTVPVPVVGLAKREEEIIREGRPPLRLPRRSRALRMLQRLRDEAHRFGLTYHRGLRTRSRVASALDDVPGIGPARRTALLKAFGSVAAMRSASADEIARRARVPARVAHLVHAALLGGETSDAASDSRAAGDRDAAAGRGR